jgi:hypothetical protein
MTYPLGCLGYMKTTYCSTFFFNLFTLRTIINVKHVEEGETDR